VCPTSNSVAATTLCNLTSDNYLSQVVLSPTHGDNILDLVFTNFPTCFKSVDIVDGLPGTDHAATQFTYTFDVKLRTADRFLYNYKRADFNHYESVLDHVPWNTIDFDNDDIGQCGRICFSQSSILQFPSPSGSREKLSIGFPLILSPLFTKSKKSIV